MDLKVLHLIVLLSLCYGFDDVSGDGTAQITSQNKNVGSDDDKAQKLNLAKEDSVVFKKKEVIAAESVHKLGKTTNTDSVNASTTSTVSPTATPLPTEAPDSKGDWKLFYNNSSTAVCTRLVAEISLEVGYKAKNSTGESVVSIPKTAKSSGNCTTETMVLSWPKIINKTEKNNSITFNFNLDNSTHFWKLVNVSGHVHMTAPSTASPKNQTIVLSFHRNNTDIFSSHVDTSYLCLKSNSYNVSLDNSSYSDFNITWAALTFSQLQVEAFKQETANTSLFGSPNNCELTPDIVPIVVGCALAALVVIVLVAYLIAQRRSLAQGYRSV